MRRPVEHSLCPSPQTLFHAQGGIGPEFFEKKPAMLNLEGVLLYLGAR